MTKKTTAPTWPSSDLQWVNQCPACGNTTYNTLYDSLTDNTFFVAPGVWSLKQCTACNSAFLSPRPTPTSVHLAYQDYYTHSSPSLPKATIKNQLMQALKNGYINKKFNANNLPANSAGYAIYKLFYSKSRIINDEFRCLSSTSKGLKLLDIGCGNGDFLKRAESLGVDATGLDFDDMAVKNAKQQGLNVKHGTIDKLDEENYYDLITASHIIEHIYDPLQFLQSAKTLLRPGGKIWIETPNINSFGHKKYRTFWRGLETPRHLIIFNYSSLNNLLKQSGFTNITFTPKHYLFKNLAAKSEAIMQGKSPYTAKATLQNKALSIIYSANLFFNPSRTEYITITAEKPES